MALENIEYSGCEESQIISTDEKFKQNRDLQMDLNAYNTIGRKRKFSDSAGGSTCITLGNGTTVKKLRRFDSKDKIVSPVIPQPGAWKRPPKVLLGAPRNRIRTTSISGKLMSFIIILKNLAYGLISFILPNFVEK